MKRSPVIVGGTLSLVSGWAAAHPPFEPLGTLPGYTTSTAWAIDDTGEFVVGACGGGPSDEPWRAFKWFHGHGMAAVPSGPSLLPAVASRTSTEGTIVVGTGADGSGYLWDTSLSAPAALPAFGLSGTVDPRALSSTYAPMVAGAIHLPDGADRAFRWSQASGYTLLPQISTGEMNGGAYGISHDGVAVCGRLSKPGGSGGQAFLWTAAGTVGLGWFLKADQAVPDSTATATNGAVTVGFSTGGTLAVTAFKYTNAVGMAELGALPGAIESRAYGVSQVGDTIVGDCTYPDGTHRAVLWDSHYGMVDLRQRVLAAGGVIPPGWVLEHACGVNIPGTTIAGTGRDPSGHAAAFIARVHPCAGDCAVCYANCDTSTAQPLLNVGDMVCFLNRFAAGDPYANCDQSTTPPVLSVLDFTCFVGKYAAGCS